MPRFFVSFFLLAALVLLAGCAPSSNVISWETASEVNTAGFNVYRGPAAEGPWTQINEALIPPAADPVRGGRYQYRDPSAPAGESYYLLEEIELDGASRRYPPTRLEAPDRRAWLPWLVAAVLAAAVGWLIGGRFRSRRRPNEDTTA